MHTACVCAKDVVVFFDDISFAWHSDLPTAIELAELIDEIADGDREAFRSLYFSTAPKLFGVAMRILRDVEKSADAVQEAYIQIWRNADQFEARKGVLEAWMVSIVRFRAIDIARRDRRRGELITEDLADDDTMELPNNAENQAVEHRITLRRCLEKLTDDQRHAILDVHLNGFTSDELAMRYETPVGTIKSRVRRGLTHLRACIERQA